MKHPSTFSIVALDPAAGEVGVAVASKFLAVGAVVPWAEAGAGAIATQAWANLSYGPRGLDLLRQNVPAEEVIARLTEADEGREHRQLGVVDAHGRAATWTGRECLNWAGGRTGAGYACQGNILIGEAVVAAMAETFEAATNSLPERLVAALAAGQGEGGDSRGQQAAALYVAKAGASYGGYLDRYVDLRVDDHDAPIARLDDLLRLHRLYFSGPDASKLTRAAGEVARQIQEALAALRFYSGPVTGRYDDATRDAFRRWASLENFEERFRDDDLVDRDVLSFLREKAGL